MEIRLRPILTTAVFLSLVALAIFAAVRILFRNGSLAFVLSVAATAAIFTYRGFVVTARDFMSHHITLTYLLLCFSAAALIAVWFLRKKYEFSRMFSVITVVAITLPTVWNLGKSIRLEMPETATDFKSPQVDGSLPSPDIYWMHCDGMLGFDAFDKYYRDKQTGFQDFLENNGFALNTGANFEAFHRTQCAVVCLMCPDYYDRVLSDRLATHEKAMEFYGNATAQAVWELADRRLSRNELYTGFLAKGYRLRFIPATPNFYLNYLPEETGMEQMFTLRDKDFLLSVFDYLHEWLPERWGAPEPEEVSEPASPEGLLPAWPDAIVKSDYGKANANFLAELTRIGNGTTPSLTVINQIAAHCPYRYDENGNRTAARDGNTDPADYPAQHRFVSEMIRANVGLILKADPDAVIVIQGDHGLHCTGAGQFRQRFGKDAEPVELWNGVISAVRVPEKYRTGEETCMAATPLNISRYLLNTFVGPNNCTYLP